MTDDTLFDLDTTGRAATLSDDGLHRYTLTRTWGSDPTHRLTMIMLNPSTADAEIDDNTITRCRRFARDLGYHALLVVNLYSFRATEPDDLKRAGYPTGGPENDQELRTALADAALHGSHIIAAWGVHAQQARVDWLLAQPGAERLTALRVTKAGQPGHPLYLPATCRPSPWPAQPQKPALNETGTAT